MNNRKIDLLIHTEVMGKVPVKTPIPCPDGIRGCAVAHYSWSPRYSTNIQDAWLVVEKFDYHRVENDAGWYYCTLANHNTKFFDGDDDKAPMAICKAALKAVGVEV